MPFPVCWIDASRRTFAFLEAQKQRVLFCLSHLGFLSLCLVLKPAHVQNAVDDDAVELRVERDAQTFCIGAHGVHGDHDVALDDIALAVVKSDDISVVVVFQKLFVGFQNALVVNKHVVQVAHFLTVFGGYAANPLIHSSSVHRWYSHTF